MGLLVSKEDNLKNANSSQYYYIASGQKNNLIMPKLDILDKFCLSKGYQQINTLEKKLGSNENKQDPKNGAAGFSFLDQVKKNSMEWGKIALSILSSITLGCSYPAEPETETQKVPVEIIPHDEPEEEPTPVLGKYYSISSVSLTQDKGLVFIAQYEENSAEDFVIVKLKEDGSVDSEIKVYDSIPWLEKWPEIQEEATRIQETPDGGYLISTNLPAENAAEGDRDWAFIKLNINGEVQWCNVIPSNGTYDSIQKVICTEDGGYVAVGSYEPGKTVSTMNDGRIIKINNQGEIVWEETIDRNYLWDYVTDIQQTADGGYFVTATSATDLWGCGQSACIKQYSWLIRLNENLGTMWEKKFDITDYNSWSHFKLADDSISGIINLGLQSLIVKLDLSGNLLSEKLVSYRGDGLKFSVDGGYIFFKNNKIADHKYVGYIADLDANFNIKWEKNLEDSNFSNVTIKSILQEENGNLIIGGYKYNDSIFRPLKYIIKFDPDGNKFWEKLD